MAHRNNLPCLLLLAPVIVCAVAQAQENSDRNAKDEKPASLFGLVTNSLTGEPLAHAHVHLQRREGTGPAAYGAISNMDGRFSMTAVSAGTYILTAEHRGFGPSSGHDPKEFTFKAGEEIKDVVVQLLPDAVIAGRVVDADGQPVQGLTVRAMSSGPSQAAETNDRGEFRIGALRPGRYLIKAFSEMPLPPEIRTDGTAPVHYGVTYYPSSRLPESATPVHVHAGQERGGLEIKLLSAPPLHVSGTVLNFPPPKYQQVNVQFADGTTGQAFIAPDGKFNLWRVPPGRHLLIAQYVDDSGKELRSAPAEIDLTNASVDGVSLALVHKFDLTGKIRMEADTKTGEGDGPSISLLPLGGLDRADEEQTLAPDGSFSIREVSPSRYHVLVSGLKENFYVKSFRLGDKESQEGILDLRSGPANDVLTVELGTNGAEISGVVIGQSGPAASAETALFFDDEYGFDLVDSATAGADGKYSFHGIAPGKYKIFAYDPRTTNGERWSADAMALYRSVTETIEVNEGAKISQDLKLLASQ